jgi:hypothetical protein
VRRDAVERVEVLGAEAQLEIAAAVGFGAQARSGQVGAAQVDPGFIDDDRLEMDASRTRRETAAKAAIQTDSRAWVSLSSTTSR